MALYHGYCRELAWLPILTTAASHRAAGKRLPGDCAAAGASSNVTDMTYGLGEPHPTRLLAQVNVFLRTALSLHGSDLHLGSFELPSMAEAGMLF